MSLASATSNPSDGVSALVTLLQSTLCPMGIREEPERMVLKKLLGPVDGPEEKIAEPSVRDRYLVGMLAVRWDRANSRTVRDHCS